MAVVQFSSIRDGAIVVTWPTLGGTDSGAPFRLPAACDLTFQVAGTFDGATCTLEGSNDGTTWHVLTQRGGSGNAGHGNVYIMAYTVAHTHSCNEMPLFVRPINSEGSEESSITVILAAFPTYAKTGY
jgi:hypothetical protein